jgi:hypothetical protein
VHVSLDEEIGEAIVSELASSLPIWRQRYFASAADRPLAIAFAFRDPAPSGAQEFLVLLARLAVPAFGPQVSRVSPQVTGQVSPDVRVLFWPEARDSSEGVGYAIEFSGRGVEEIGWWAIP